MNHVAGHPSVARSPYAACRDRGRGLLPDVRLKETPSEPHRWLEELAYRYGRSYESYLVIEPNRECFWLPDRKGAVAFLRKDRYLHVGGGLLAAGRDRPLLLKSFVDWARGKGLSILFYNVLPEDLALFREFGFQATKWGEESIIDLAGVTGLGRQYEWVRRQSHYALRNGLIFSECRPETLSADEWESVVREVEEICSGTIAERPQVGDIGFLNGCFDPANLGRRRLFLARNTRHERIDGFLLCNPCRGGAEWALEVYRDRPDAVRGTIPFLMHQALLQFQTEGIERASLCLVAAAGCEQPMPGDSPLIRRALAMSRYFGFIFDVVGLYHFKSRFRPRFEDRYICASPAVTLGAAKSFVQICGALRLDPVKLMHRLWRHLTHARVRANLARSGG